MNSKTPDPMAIEEAAIRAAISRRVSEFKESAVKLADARPWIKDRPLTSCLVAAGVGMGLGMLAGGRKSAAPRQTTSGGAQAPSHHQDRRTLGAMLAASLVPTLQPMISDLIHTAMGGLAGGARGGDKTADVTEDSRPSGLAEDNKVVV